jgi:hypothetical protein
VATRLHHRALHRNHGNSATHLSGLHEGHVKPNPPDVFSVHWRFHIVINQVSGTSYVGQAVCRGYLSAHNISKACDHRSSLSFGHRCLGFLARQVRELHFFLSILMTMTSNQDSI